MTAEPISADEGRALIDGAFKALRSQGISAQPPARFALAVSGGPDSLAMLVLAADWSAARERLGGRPVEWVVVTVDHGLRPAAALEARHVAAIAARFGLRHHTLHWTGPKPTSAVMETARIARYALLRDHARANGIAAVLCAHMAEDQAETVLMRLARGSGIDGLGGIEPVSHLDGLVVARPLLAIRKSRLVATLESRGIAWVEDPTNRDPAYERTRWRSRLTDYERLGLTVDVLGRSARRLARAGKALDAAAAVILRDDHGCAGARLGYASMSLSRWQSHDEELKLRALSALVRWIGGNPAPPTMTQLENAVARLEGDQPRGFTLARCRFIVEHDGMLLVREPDRMPLPELTLSPGETAHWDGRFVVTASATMTKPIMVQPLDAGQLNTGNVPVAHMDAAARVPPAALRVLPSFWDGPSLVAVPSLAEVDASANQPPRLSGLCSARVTGLTPQGQWSIGRV